MPLLEVTNIFLLFSTDWPWDDFRIILRECREKAPQRLDGKLSKIGKTSREWNRARHPKVWTYLATNYGRGNRWIFIIQYLISVPFQDEKNQILTTNVWLNLVSFLYFKFTLLFLMNLYDQYVSIPFRGPSCFPISNPQNLYSINKHFVTTSNLLIYSQLTLIHKSGEILGIMSAWSLQTN